MSVDLATTGFPHHLIPICLKLVNGLKVAAHSCCCNHTTHAMVQASGFRKSPRKICFCATFEVQGMYFTLESFHYKLPK